MIWSIMLLLGLTLFGAVQLYREIDRPSLETDGLKNRARDLAILVGFVLFLTSCYQLWPYLSHCSVSSIIYGCDW